jgi:hypothetical protein
MNVETIYYIKAKTASAKEQLKALSLAGEIEILPMDDIPQWQKTETARRLAIMKSHPETCLALEEFQAILQQEDED